MSTFWRGLANLANLIFRSLGGRYLTKLDEEIALLFHRLDSLESAMSELDDLYTELDEATNDVAERLDSLIEQVNGNNLSAAAVVARLTPLRDRLKAMGQDNLVTPPTDPTTNTDPTNSPDAESPLVNPAPDAPTDEPTPDPTVNPVDIPAESLPDTADANRDNQV